jgi:hypothetical protein
MRRPVLIWTAGIGSLVVLDVALDQRHDGSTLSEVTRLVYRTDTPLGRCAFVASWLALSGWFVPHICKRIEGSLST